MTVIGKQVNAESAIGPPRDDGDPWQLLKPTDQGAYLRQLTNEAVAPSGGAPRSAMPRVRQRAGINTRCATNNPKEEIAQLIDVSSRSRPKDKEIVRPEGLYARAKDRRVTSTRLNDRDHCPNRVPELGFDFGLVHRRGLRSGKGGTRHEAGDDREGPKRPVTDQCDVHGPTSVECARLPTASQGMPR